jgi:hypothetical protein
MEIQTVRGEKNKKVIVFFTAIGTHYSAVSLVYRLVLLS